MTFIESIQVCFKKYADFNGCASRPEFWWWALFVFLGSMALGIVNIILRSVTSQPLTRSRP